MCSDNSRMPPAQRVLFYAGLSLLIIVKLFAALPAILDFQKFAFGDTGGFQNLDRLIKQGLHLGVDVGYIYGFLPILLQHVVFAVFGTGHWQSLAFVAVDILLIIFFWVLLCRECGASWLQFGVLVGLSGMIASRAAEALTPAHVLLEVCLVFSLYFVLRGRLRLALVLAMLGSLAVPSLPLVLTGLLSLVIVWEWWKSPHHSARDLVSQVAPAVIVYVGTVILLTALFSWYSVIPSLLPLRGMAEYRAMHFGFFSAGYHGGKYYGGKIFWDPPGAHFTYYLGSKIGIWLLCSVLLAGFAFTAGLQIFRTKILSARSLFIILCCLLHFFFVGFGFAGPFSSVYYESILAAGVFVGFSTLTDRRVRIAICSVLLVLGLLSQKSETRANLKLGNGSIGQLQPGGYMFPKNFDKEWENVITLAAKHNLFMLVYGNGVGHYYPRVQTAESWMLMPGVLVPREKEFVLEKLRAADVVVESTYGVTLYIDENSEWQAVLAQFPVKITGKHFRIWMRDNVAQATLRPAQ